MLDSVKSIVEDPALVRERRSQLVSAAIILFNRMGFYSTTVKDIASEAGFSAGLVYQYVGDKHDVLFLALQKIVETNKERIPAALQDVTDPMARLICAIDAYCRVLAANGDAVLLTYRETKSLKRAHKETLKRLERETNSMISACLDQCEAKGYLAIAKIELLTYHIVAVAHAWALKHWRLREITTLDEYIRLNVHSAWQACLTTAGKRHYARMHATIEGGVPLAVGRATARSRSRRSTARAASATATRQGVP